MIFCGGVTPDGEVIVKQRLLAPSVYLDHVALRKISDNGALASPLRDALRSKKGTLAISALNRGEFVSVSVTDQAAAAEKLVGMLWPNVFFMSVDMGIVSMREIELLPTTVYPDGSLACDDQEVLKAIGQRFNPQTAAIHLTMGELFGLHSQNEKHQDYLKQMRDAGRLFLSQWHAAKMSPEYKAKRLNFRRRMRKTGIMAPRASGPLFTTMLEIFDREIPAPRDNDFNDFLHACVPSSYCDFVFLDNSWRHVVEQVRRDLVKDNIKTPIARVFSEKGGGMEKFFRALEEHPGSPPIKGVSLKSIIDLAKLLNGIPPGMQS